MSLFAVHYTYDERAAEREAVRPEHRAYFRSLADRGEAVAFGRYEDEQGPGALIILDVDSKETAEARLDADPYVREGLVVTRQVRAWPAWGPWSE